MLAPVLRRPLCLWWLPRNTQPKINIEQNFRLGCLFWPYTSIYQHGARRAPIPAIRFSAHVLVLAGLWFANLLFRRNPGVEPRRHRPGFYLGSGSPLPAQEITPKPFIYTCHGSVQIYGIICWQSSKQRERERAQLAMTRRLASLNFSCPLSSLDLAALRWRSLCRCQKREKGNAE